MCFVLIFIGLIIFNLVLGLIRFNFYIIQFFIILIFLNLNHTITDCTFTWEISTDF
jgi:hypothetical protein